MTLAIHKLLTRCRVPKGSEATARLLDDAAHSALLDELGAQLGPSLDRLPAVVRVRGLRVKLRISGRQVSTKSIASGWARALTLALHRALAHPDGDGSVGIVRFVSRATYQAAMLRHVLGGGPRKTWRFPELALCRSSSVFQSCLELLLAEPPLIGDTLFELQAGDWLDPLLLTWDELSLEHLMNALATSAPVSDSLSFDDFLKIALVAAAPGGLQGCWRFDSRRQAIRLWMRLSRRYPVRQVWHSLRLLKIMLETPVLFSKSASELLAGPIPFPQWCAAALEHVQAQASSHRMFPSSTATEELLLAFSASRHRDIAGILDLLRPSLPTSVRLQQCSEWVVSNCAGMLLLTASLRRLNFWALSHNPRFGVPRSLSFVLMGIGMNLLGPWQPGDHLDSAVTIFSGCFGTPDRSALQEFFKYTDVSEASEFANGSDWQHWFAAAGEKVVRDFARRIRGFRESSLPAVVKQFLRVPGRLLVEDKRLLVELASSPWSVALHISSAYDRVEGVEWLSHKDVEFIQEGL